jgi:hypothetical protein
VEFIYLPPTHASLDPCPNLERCFAEVLVAGPCDHLLVALCEGGSTGRPRMTGTSEIKHLMI